MKILAWIETHEGIHYLHVRALSRASTKRVNHWLIRRDYMGRKACVIRYTK